MRGAGGTPGGTGSFFLGLIMMCVGFYMLLHAIVVSNPFSMGYALYHVGSMGVTSGMLLVPMIFGIGMVFYNSRNYLGWTLFIGAIAAVIFGVLASLQFSLRYMSLFELLVILILCFGGVGLFLRSLRTTS